MVPLIDDILRMQERLDNESMLHLKQKADLSFKLRDLTSKEITLSNKLSTFKENLSSEKNNQLNQTSVEIEELLKNKNQLEDEINKIQKELGLSEEKITKLKTQSSIIDSKITASTQEKNRLLQNIKRKEFLETKTKRSNIKITNEKQKIKKMKIQLEKQGEIYKNIKSFLKAIKQIEEVLAGFSSIDNVKVQYSSNISEAIIDQIIEAKRSFDSAQTKFKPNNVIPFLIEADKAYRTIVSAFIKLNVELPKYSSLSEEKFNHQVFTLVKHGLKLNTRHLNAVKNMLAKLEKGVEIAPLASFANEIRDYFVENLSIFRITGIILFLD